MTDTGERHEGGCFCGAVRYALHEPPTYSAHCHCRSCRRAVGAGLVTWSGVQRGNFEVTAGEIAIYESSPGVRRGFCRKCGTSLTFDGDDWTDLAVLSATLDDPGVAKPTTNVYLEHRLAWVVLDESLTKYDRFPRPTTAQPGTAGDMARTFAYACRDYPGMEACPGQFIAETEAEIWQLMELHASVAHDEDPGAWSDEDRAQLKALIKTEQPVA